MQLIIEFIPVIAFFVAYKLADIYVATAVLIVAVVLHSAIQWIRTRTVSKMQLISAGLVLVFGGLTLAIRDEAFIMWKPTIVNWLFAVAFLASQYRMFGGQPIVRRLMEGAESGLRLPEQAWIRLNYAWVIFFAALGAANLYVFQHFSESTWVNFKLFGLLGLTFLFVLAQGLWLASTVRQTSDPEP
ncbi:MAG: septation protein A [Steroidobacteraceae bacterium]